MLVPLILIASEWLPALVMAQEDSMPPDEAQTAGGLLVRPGRTGDWGGSRDKLGGLGRQATVGLIVVGQLIGTAIAMVILLQPALSQFVGFAYLAMIAFAVTLLVSFWVLFRMLFGRDEGPNR